MRPVNMGFAATCQLHKTTGREHAAHLPAGHWNTHLKAVLQLINSFSTPAKAAKDSTGQLTRLRGPHDGTQSCLDLHAHMEALLTSGC